MLDRPNVPLTDSADPATSWVVVNTQAHRERLAIENLERQSYVTYCPLIRTRVRHARKTIDALRPLFPGYLFVALDLDRDRWRPMLSTLGVRSVVRNGDRPARLDPAFIASIKAREIEGAVVRPPSPYRVGQSVKLAGGAFDGIVAQIIALDSTQERLVVLLNLLQHEVKTKVAVTQVRPV